MNESKDQILSGGNMNAPVLRNQHIYKEATLASNTIHNLLQHVRAKGIDWVPESFGVNSEGKHVLSYFEGEVPHDTPDWLWEDTILCDIAKRLRLWHDATLDFNYTEAKWLLENDEVNEVICHIDFAPYNCVFQNKKFVGLIDFDVCAPGSRLWDIAYTAYRFVPLMPVGSIEVYKEVSPFTKEVLQARLQRFLEAYGGNDHEFLYDKATVIHKVEKRLRALANWSRDYGVKTNNSEMTEHAQMYDLHADWVKILITD